jgi:hypothetical protein
MSQSLTSTLPIANVNAPIVASSQAQVASIVNSIIQSLTSQNKFGSINAVNIINYTTEAMQLAEAYPNLNGTDKSVIVINVLQNLVANTNLPLASQAALDLLITQTVPGIITAICAASKGLLALNKKIATSCSSSCSLQ